MYKGHFTQTENETDIEKISIHSTGMATVHLNKAGYRQSGLESLWKSHTREMNCVYDNIICTC